MANPGSFSATFTNIRRPRSSRSLSPSGRFPASLDSQPSYPKLPYPRPNISHHHHSSSPPHDYDDAGSAPIPTHHYVYTRPTTYRNCVITTGPANHPARSGMNYVNYADTGLSVGSSSISGNNAAIRQNSYFPVVERHNMPQANRSNMSTAAGRGGGGGVGGASSSPGLIAADSSNNSDFSHHLQQQPQQSQLHVTQGTPLSMRLSMPFRTAFSQHTTGDRGDLFNEDFMDNVFQLDRPFGFNNNLHSRLRSRSPFSLMSGERDGDDLFAALDNNDSFSQFRNQPASRMLNSRNHPFSSSSSSSSQDSGGSRGSGTGELEDTIHHIIHTEEPDQLEQRVKIFIAQDRARGLDSPTGTTMRQPFPRISARLPQGGSLSFSFSTSGGSTTMHIEDGQVPPHPMLSIDQKKQLKERLMAQKNDFRSGPNTSAMILTSDKNDQSSDGKSSHSPGSVAERVMWFEGFPQLQITHHPAGRMHRSAAHIALQNWRNANSDFMDFPQLPPFAPHHHGFARSNSNSVEREIPIIREGEPTPPPPNKNAISITLEVPAKQTATYVRSATGSDSYAPSKPGNLSGPSVASPKTSFVTEPLQKAAVYNTQSSAARSIEMKPTERIVPTILPSPEPKPADKQRLKQDEAIVLQEPEIKPTLVRNIGAKEIDKDPAAKSAEVRKASQNIMKALQNGMRKEEKLAQEPKASIPEPVIEKAIQKRVSPPKTITSPRSPPISSVLSSKENIPPFHYPRGKPAKSDSDYTLMEKVHKSFNGKSELKLDEMKDLMSSLSLPLYWRRPLLLAAVGSGSPRDTVTFEMVWNTWKRITTNCYDDASRFICLLAKPGCNFVLPDDCTPLIQVSPDKAMILFGAQYVDVQDVVDTHPGLNILKEAPEFHARYINTVIARMFFCINRSWTGKITIEELRRSNFLQVLATLEHEDDINVITDFFSYEHFYVIYCKFWELDRDHDLLIDKADLARHNDHAISSKMIDRIFSGAVTRGQHQKNGKMSYSEFVWFLIAEEDKRHPRSVEYWFRCMDLDGDGVLSLYELEYFYEEQLQRMKSLGIEALPFEDIACQMLDMVHPKHKDRILLTDLKRCRMTPLFFDSFFNIEKYLLHEHRDPFASAKVDSEDNEPISDWERYAAEEYEMLVSEDAASEEL